MCNQLVHYLRNGRGGDIYHIYRTELLITGTVVNVNKRCVIEEVSVAGKNVTDFFQV